MIKKKEIRKDYLRTLKVNIPTQKEDQHEIT